LSVWRIWYADNVALKYSRCGNRANGAGFFRSCTGMSCEPRLDDWALRTHPLLHRHWGVSRDARCNIALEHLYDTMTPRLCHRQTVQVSREISDCRETSRRNSSPYSSDTNLPWIDPRPTGAHLPHGAKSTLSSFFKLCSALQPVDTTSNGPMAASGWRTPSRPPAIPAHELQHNESRRAQSC
jgi:hypothetical protein